MPIDILSFQPVNSTYAALSMRQSKAVANLQLFSYTMSAQVSTLSMLIDVVKQERGSFSMESYRAARLFVDRMPMDIAKPEVSIDPDGEICFEWYKSDKEVCSVTFGSNGMYYIVGVTEEEEFAHSTNAISQALAKIQEIVYADAA